MSQHFLRYIPWESLQHWKHIYVIERYAGGEKFDSFGIRQGDVIWGVSIPLMPGSIRLGKGLVLFGKLQIGCVTSDRTKIQRMMGTRDIWAASRYAIAREGTEVPYTEIDISTLAPQIRFESVRDRLTIEDGRIGAQQLQTMRRLTPDSVALLEEAWTRGRKQT